MIGLNVLFLISIAIVIIFPEGFLENEQFAILIISAVNMLIGYFVIFKNKK